MTRVECGTQDQSLLRVASLRACTRCNGSRRAALQRCQRRSERRSEGGGAGEAGVRFAESRERASGEFGRQMAAGVRPKCCAALPRCDRLCSDAHTNPRPPRHSKGGGEQWGAGRQAVEQHSVGRSAGERGDTAADTMRPPPTANFVRIAPDLASTRWDNAVPHPSSPFAVIPVDHTAQPRRWCKVC